LIETQAGRSISDIFASAGEAAFREMERHLVEEMNGYSDTIIATGGGLPCFHDNLAALKAHALTVCLWASPEAIWERVKHQSHRPLLQAEDPVGRIRDLLTRREPFYRQADILVSTESRSSRDIAALLIHEFQVTCRKSP
jgi:shikimate kinase